MTGSCVQTPAVLRGAAAFRSIVDKALLPLSSWCWQTLFNALLEDRQFQMPYEMNEQQFANVMALPNEKRLWHFVAKVCDWEKVWGVGNDDGWLVPIAPEGFEYFPVWPHPDYALRSTDRMFPGNRPEEISIDDFLSHTLRWLTQNKTEVAVFPNMDWEFWVIDPAYLAEYLREEISNYE